MAGRLLAGLHIMFGCIVAKYVVSTDSGCDQHSSCRVPAISNELMCDDVRSINIVLSDRNDYVSYLLQNIVRF